MGILGGFAKKAAAKAALKVASEMYLNYDESKRGEKAQTDKCTFQNITYIYSNEVLDERKKRIYKLKKPAFSHGLILTDLDGEELGKISASKFLGDIDIRVSADGKDYGSVVREVSVQNKFSISKTKWSIEQFKMFSDSYAVYDKYDEMIFKFHYTNTNSIVLEYDDSDFEHIGILVAKTVAIYESLISK